MYPKFAAFQLSLREQGLSHSKLYFAKVDVEACFDTIPQRRLVIMADSLLSLDEYQTGRHAEIAPLGRLQSLEGSYSNPAPVTRYVPHGGAAGELTNFEELVQDRYVGMKANTVFVDSAVRRFEAKDDMMRLLKEHVEQNLVKIGKKFYRQKNGIPQGSVLSTLLCSFFYAELERDLLGFLDKDSLLVRLLDDFLLVTIRKEHAERFLKVMHHGHPEYGVVIKAEKSLANFDIALNPRQRIPKPDSDSNFPFCGILIDTTTLDVKRNREGKGSK
jgi:telomerase reverse transcriptase